MAISTYRVSIAPTWTKADIINQWEDAFEWLDWHGEEKTGLIVGFGATINNQSAVVAVEGNANTYYPDVFPKSTSGIGTGASFHVSLSAGRISQLYVNRPGYGYTGGELITLDAADIGRTHDLSFKVAIAATVSNAVSYAVTFTDTYNANGTDRNGVVSGTSTTITIREGDTLELVNNNSSSNYGISVCWMSPTNTISEGYLGNSYLQRKFWNVIGQNNNNNAGGITTFKPYPGQAGEYVVLDDYYTHSSVPRIVVEPALAGSISSTGYGSTTTFYAKNTTATYPYGVLRHEIAANKKFGDTYRIFGFGAGSDNLTLWVGSGVSPFKSGVELSTDSGFQNLAGGSALGERMAGNRYLDMSDVLINNSYATFTFANAYYNSQTVDADSRISTGANFEYPLDLNIYRSGLDPKFVVFSYKAPTLSSTKLRDNTFGTIIFHNFTNTDLWDNDDVFLGGYTEILYSDSETYSTGPRLIFKTQIAGNAYQYSGNTRSRPSKRMAEFGYNYSYSSIGNTGNPDWSSGFVHYDVSAINNPKSTVSENNARIYYRSKTDSPMRSRGGDSQTTDGNQWDNVGSGADFNAVIKGIPLNGNLIPVPYYMPDDFVLIQFHYSTNNANIQQGDTITISGSEVYTVITGSYNQDENTRGILFCARTT